jgi:hypothetical protein
MSTYAPGQTVVLSATFLNAATGAPITPSALELRVLDPTGNETDYTTGFANPSIGLYTYNLIVRFSGTWFYRWVATGTYYAAGEGSFIVDKSVFLVGPLGSPP